MRNWDTKDQISRDGLEILRITQTTGGLQRVEILTIQRPLGYRLLGRNTVSSTNKRAFSDILQWVLLSI